MAFAILLSQPEITLNAENRITSQSAALMTSFPTMFKCWSNKTLVELAASDIFYSPLLIVFNLPLFNFRPNQLLDS